jgi:hypothetical protein
MDPRNSIRVDPQEQMTAATLWLRIKVFIIAGFLGLSVGLAVATILDALGRADDSDTAFASTFVGLMVGWAFYILGAHLVKIWALLSDHARATQHSSTS